MARGGILIPLFFERMFGDGENDRVLSVVKRLLVELRGA